MRKFNLNQYAANEVELARQILANQPENIPNRDRLAYWSLKLGDIETAREFGTSDKLQHLIKEWESKNS